MILPKIYSIPLVARNLSPTEIMLTDELSVIEFSASNAVRKRLRTTPKTPGFSAGVANSLH